ncbi:MAG: hypothetical protein AAF648_04925 [Pseudomonadota bacterium]
MLFVLANDAVASDALTFAPPRHTPEPAVTQALSESSVRLNRGPSPSFTLLYRGPLAQFVGPLCYRIAGYTETCVRLPNQWLTPATDIELNAPGGVPLDLLDGYRLEIRFPRWGDRVYRPTPVTDRAKTPNDG